MSNSKLSQKEQEELNKLENEALEELYQIIAIAYQVQDIDYIDSMISAWKAKYKKILDNPSPDFKKKIEKLLNESYSKVVEYILSQIKFKEEQAIKNQRRALNELYRIIKDNYDLDTVKKKIKTWESKYPYDSFLKMYQKRIDSAKREKNLEENAFKQEEAFKDLYYGVANRSGTIEELKEYLHKWEEKYSINNKFTIEQFIKHQSEVKRYVSDEFLISIAKKDEHILDTVPSRTCDSTLSSQDSAYKRLKSIIKGKHNIDEVFKWVYENNSIKFNDYYKQRILTDTDLNYSPKYLKTLSVPNIDLSKPVLSIEQYNKIDEIKRYAIISYFNLLLPPNEAISNNYFTEHIRTIYYESERRKHSNIINTFKDEVTPLAKEIDLKLDLNDVKGSADKTSFEDKVPETEENEPSTAAKDKQANIEPVSDSNSEIKNNDARIITTSDTENNILDIEKLISSSDEPHTIKVVTYSKTNEPRTECSTTTKQEIKESTPEEPAISEVQNISVSIQSIDNYEVKTPDSIISKTDDTEIKPIKSDINSVTVSVVESDLSEEKPIVHKSANKSNISDISESATLVEESKQDIDYDTIVAFSPDFFEAINNYSIQARLVETASKTAQKINNTIPLAIHKSDNKTRNQSE